MEEGLEETDEENGPWPRTSIMPRFLADLLENGYSSPAKLRRVDLTLRQQYLSMTVSALELVDTLLKMAIDEEVQVWLGTLYLQLIDTFGTFTASSYRGYTHLTINKVSSMPVRVYCLVNRDMRLYSCFKALLDTLARTDARSLDKLMRRRIDRLFTKLREELSARIALVERSRGLGRP